MVSSSKYKLRKGSISFGFIMFLKLNCYKFLQALLYVIKLLDPIVKGDYVIAYFHTLTSTSNYPSLQWLRDVYSVLPYK